MKRAAVSVEGGPSSSVPALITNWKKAKGSFPSGGLLEVFWPREVLF